VREFLPHLIQWQRNHGYPFTLFTEASMDLALPKNQDVLEGMVQAGFDTVFVGIESDDPDVLKGMNKAQNMAHYTPLEKVKRIQRGGLKVQGGFIIGSDEEKPEVFDRMFKFIQEAGIPTAMVGLLGALKGTKLYERLEKEGRLTRHGSGDNTRGLEFNFKPVMDEKFLLDGYAQLLKRLFDSKNYYERCRVQDDMLGPHRSQNRKTASGLRAFANVMYDNLISDPEFEFVKYVVRTLAKNPNDFSEAIANAVKLHHFQTIANATVTVKGYRERVEELYQGFIGRVEELKGETEEKLRAFGKMQKRLERKAVKMYHQIPTDFRDNAAEYLEGLRNRVNGLRTSYFAS